MATGSITLAVAVEHHRAGRLQPAIEIYQQILAAVPNHALARNNLGVAFMDQGNVGEAIACYRLAMSLDPCCADIHSNLGNALRTIGQLDEAVACCRHAIEMRPSFPEAHNNLGLALAEQGKPDEAVIYYRRAMELRPTYPEAHSNLGNAFRELGRLDEAIACYRRAIQFRPDFADAYSNLGAALKDRGQVEEAIACCRRAMGLRPDRAELHSNLLYALLFSPGCDAATIYEEHCGWNRQHATRFENLIQPHKNDRTPGRRLKIGYVSPDFRDHCQALFTVPLFAHHDRENFEIVCYSDVARPDDVTERLRWQVGAWRNIAGLNDEQVAALIREDRIDILVDLTMHMARNRLLVFARKPAPVQVCWLAYPGTTGLKAIDYRITDPYLDPPGLYDGCVSEESIHLPDTFWCYDPLDSQPAVNALPAAEKGFITFGCLNNFCKINPLVLKLWAGVLKEVDGSRLTILAGEGTHRQRTLDLLAEEGVAGERVTFIARRPRPQYLLHYHDIDIGLDTVPYNGHTTSLDSFWMGVPVVTLVGKTVVGRAGLCQLMNLGLPELIALDPEQYVQVAAGLAHDLARLSGLRATLSDRMQASPLMDAPRFARNIEAAYREMWRRWCARQPSA